MTAPAVRRLRDSHRCGASQHSLRDDGTGLAAAVQGIEAIIAGNVGVRSLQSCEPDRIRDRATLGLPRACCGPVLFRAYGGDAERVHEQTLATLAGSAGSRPVAARWPPLLRPAPQTGRPSPESGFPAWSAWRPGWTRTASRRPGLGRPGLRLRRARHGHRAAPARQ